MFFFSLHKLSPVCLWWMLYLMFFFPGWNVRDGTPLWRDLHCVDRFVVSFINLVTSSMIFILIAVLTFVRYVYIKVISFTFRIDFKWNLLCYTLYLVIAFMWTVTVYVCTILRCGHMIWFSIRFSHLICFLLKSYHVTT